MRFDLQAFLLNPFVIVFFTMVVGNLFGKIKFGSFKFGIAGTLFVGLVIGVVLTLYGRIIPEGATQFNRAQEVLRGNIISGPISTLSLLMFIVGTGFIAAEGMAYALTKFGKQFVVLAIIIPLAGAVTAYGAAKLMPGMNGYQVSGTYTGSLTSSAGLAAALESAEGSAEENGNNYENLSDGSKAKVLLILNEAGKREAALTGEAYEELTLDNTKSLTPEQIETYKSEAQAGVGIGHSIGYPFGVLFVVLAAHFIPNLFRIDVAKEIKEYEAEKERDFAKAEKEGKVKEPIKEVVMDFASFSLAIVLGYALGSIEIYLGPLGYFGLGSIGGSIIVALLLGHIGKFGPFTFRMSHDVLGSLRTFFLSVFLAGTGLNYGYRAWEALTGGGLSIAIVSSLVAIVAILVGFIVGRYVFKITWPMLAGAIVGGMTSAPGLGAALDAVGTDDPAAGYAATQPIATLMMVLFSLILHKLPL